MVSWRSFSIPPCASTSLELFRTSIACLERKNRRTILRLAYVPRVIPLRIPFRRRYFSPVEASRRAVSFRSLRTFEGAFFFFLPSFPPLRGIPPGHTRHVSSTRKLILIELNTHEGVGERAEEGTHAAAAQEHEHLRGVEIESQGLATPELHAARWQDG